jgi:Tfp pilus assembly protein PilF
MPELNGRQVADLKFALARSLEKRGELGPAADAYREVLRSDPARADACWRLAVLSDRIGKPQEALGWYRKALAGMPGNADIYCDMGYSLSLQQRWGEAEMNLRQAVALAPQNARAHNNLGLVLAHTGRRDEALTEFRKAGCNEADGRVNLAYVLTLDKSWSEARKQYEMALAADATSSPARKGLHELDVLVARVTGPAAIQQAKFESEANAEGASKPDVSQR